MSKDRLNISVDEWVADELRRREDINISGAANDFFKEYLSGRDKDDVAREMRINRLKEEEEKHQEEAQQKRAEWQRLKDEMQNTNEDKRRELNAFLDDMADKGMKVPKSQVGVQNLADDWFNGDVDECWNALKARNEARENTLDDSHFKDNE